MKKIALATALAFCLPAFAQVPNPAPMQALRTMETLVDIGKSNEQAVKTAVSAMDCTLNASESEERILTGANGKGCLGSTHSMVSFLGPNHVSDSFSLSWDFTERKDFDQAKDSLVDTLKKIYNINGRYNPGSLFQDGIRFKTNTSQVIYVTWDTYGGFLKVEVIDEGAADETASIEEVITTLVKEFPDGKGKVHDLTKFAESWGCIVKDSGHPRWVTMAGRASKNCKGLNIFFDRGTEDSQDFTSIRFNPALPAEEQSKLYGEAYKKLFGTPEKIMQPRRDEPSEVYKDGNTGIILNEVSYLGKPSVEVFISSYEDAMNTAVKEEKKEEKKEDKAKK